MKMIGITGRSGCGKSTVTSYYKSLGLAFADADALSRQVLEPGSPCLPLLAERFGADILDENGALKRRLLADRAFATPEGTQALTNITHPEILRRTLALRDLAEKAGEALFFLDGAVIIGSIFERYCDDFILITAPFETSVQRICARDGISAEMAARRLNAQLPEETLRKKARYILNNDTSTDALLLQADNVLEQLRKECHAR